MADDLVLADEAATLRLGAALAERLRIGDVVTLSGPLGSGKTTLARGALAALGLEGEAASPSFPIVIAYDPPEVALPVWHVDLYRIERAEEMAELGLDEARSDGALLVEWPERGGDIWGDALALTFSAVQDGGRRLTWAAGASWAGRWPPPPPR
jgi:tRNA threonylcarbamoyladenosine biosynthesis protein TsaE